MVKTTGTPRAVFLSEEGSHVPSIYGAATESRQQCHARDSHSRSCKPAVCEHHTLVAIKVKRKNAAVGSRCLYSLWGMLVYALPKAERWIQREMGE
jgi:hypothetical protein